ncbi:3-carboxy-cis,cis-muconate cycloisomerase [Catenulispora pinisilvae]|uniref:3-carboxy-cis,cis-muconate cycloisomerase n=1 Tax=Catenulispora pinisilvae TaxID=2705253 RepID=UPI001891D625|nr:3-carboxy-cis,cis-muconate cycloisomerase [Catenulispora pinisilvae]
MTSADLGLLAPVWAGTPVEEMTGDAAFLQAMLDAEAALTRSQAALGQAPDSAAMAVTAASRAEDFDLRGIAVRARESGNPVIPLVADLTAAAPPEAAEFVHRGATSQDILDTAVMLVATRTVAAVLGELRSTADVLGRLAAEYRDTPMAGRTLGQHAVPTTFGLKAVGWRSLVLDATDRLAALRLPAQLGGAAGTLAAFETLADAPGSGGDLAKAFARELGLAEPELPWHVLRTPIADLAAALAFTVGALGKIAADVLVLSRTELGEVAEGSAGGSSAMPHKANPVRATLIAAAARQAPALAAVLFGALAAEDERPAGAWHSEWQTLRELLRLTGGAVDAAAALVEGLRVFPSRMLDNLHRTQGLVVSERLAAELSGLLGRGPAKRLLTDAAERAASRGLGLAEVLAAAPDLKGLITGDRLHQLTDPAEYLGAAAALVDRALERKAS